MIARKPPVIVGSVVHLGVSAPGLHRDDSVADPIPFLDLERERFETDE